MLNTIRRLGVVLSVLSIKILAKENYLSDEFIGLINTKATTWRAIRNFNTSTSIEHLACAGPDFLDPSGTESDPDYDFTDYTPNSEYSEYAPYSGYKKSYKAYKQWHKSFKDYMSSEAYYPKGYTGYGAYPINGDLNFARQIPQHFDARTYWPHCPSIREVHNQGECGTCWAVAPAAAMTDRVCLHSGGSDRFVVSAQDLVTCCHRCRDYSSDVCRGGISARAWTYWYTKGIVSGGPFGSQHSCRPYAFPPINPPTNDLRRSNKVVGKAATCERKCAAGYGRDYAADLRYARSVYSLKKGSVSEIQAEIFRRGPVGASMRLYEDFYNYESGVYRHVAGQPDGHHVVRLIGWGVESGTPYWLAINSWGAKWGRMGGLFKIVRGENHCGIEAEINGGLPRLESNGPITPFERPVPWPKWPFDWMNYDPFKS